MGSQDIFMDLDYVKGDHAISEQSPYTSLFAYPLPSKDHFFDWVKKLAQYDC